MRRFVSILGVCSTLGCLTQLPPSGGREYLAIPWAKDFPAAQAQAQAERKPLLVCLVSGLLDGNC